MTSRDPGPARGSKKMRWGGSDMRTTVALFHLIRSITTMVRGTVSQPETVPATHLVGRAAAGDERLHFIKEYSCVRKLGHGGMGTVYLLRHKETGEHIALKIMQ